MARTYGVDVAVYQPTDLASYHKAGASFAIVKLTEGTGYFNPKAQAQVTSARANHLYTHAYHFANFGSSVSQAKKEAKYFLTWVKKTNISKKRMLWLDWEPSSANRVDGARSANTAAILAFMRALKDAGYRPGLYAGAALMRSAIDTKRVISKFGTCLWVASYPTADPVSAANFGYFPALDGVAIWQFTNNWKGLNVDGNVAVVDLHNVAAKPAPKKSKPTSKWVKKGGTFTLKKALHLHKSPKITAGSIAKLKAGDVVSFDAVLQGPKRVWLRQPRSDGKYGYIVAQDKNGKATGKIKY
ncbi:lysa [Lactobacillus equicursoris DSM 19284 = JCM 14600 = CIP 110162]|uniref:Lysozyme n=2 Tax=Lactobacillus equicursoris TaxID=420645 RepID=A0A0R1M7B5_9LACO|nr:GH25 family lysozyme [Lactobacillus equicursoris]KRL00666.1 lysa [Lactobacillus equicursoris DSM 19284 = JCM 14600 = CIP 110162]